jgi:RNA polymerase-interacting CarD/CdnL/TRCF family regulator
MIETDNFQVGCTVIHWAYGLGEIIQLDEKELFGGVHKYYVVKINDLTIWVPSSDDGDFSLRLPTPAEDFEKLFKLLASPGEPLPDDRLERKTLLASRLKEGRLEDICLVIRDLSHQNHIKKLNEQDNAVLERAKKFLLSEWSAVLATPIATAGRELKEMLG